MIGPRRTRLVRVADLHAFRNAIVQLSSAGELDPARPSLVVVPTRNAALQLGRMFAGASASLVTRDELYDQLHARLSAPPRRLTVYERDVMMQAAAREGACPSVRIRPGFVSEMLRFYDQLRCQGRTIARFEELLLERLAQDAEYDRGAARMLEQTRFLGAAFRAYERRMINSGACDEHAMRARLLNEQPADPIRGVVVTVGDWIADEKGLYLADFDLLTRLPGLETLDVVATDRLLASGFHQRIHEWLPGIEEVATAPPTIPPPASEGPVVVCRDREEELIAIARTIRAEPRASDSLERIAIVFKRPLPYLYLAREAFGNARIAYQAADALPLAAEPFAAALDVLFACVTGDCGRRQVTGLMRSPHFDFGSSSVAEALPAIESELSPLRNAAPCAHHLDCVLQFLRRHDRMPAGDDPHAARLLRGRAAILDTLTSLRDAYARFDATPVMFDDVTAIVRRRIEAHTFTPQTGDRGVHVVDADSARFGDFERVQLAGLVDGEWPDSPRRNIFYPPMLLRELGWPPESERLDGIRATFTDLLRLPSGSLLLSTFTLEDDALTTLSPLVDSVAAAGLETAGYGAPAARIFEYEALAGEPVDTTPLGPHARAAAQRRIHAGRDRRPAAGTTKGHRPAAFSLSSLERYQDCPFKFFAADVLRLEEPVDDDPLSPRERGRFVHEVFQRFFEAWDRRGDGTITVDRLDEARRLFDEVAEPLLARLPDAEAALQRAHLFGSAVARGIVNVVLELEASRPAEVSERWLEYRLEGDFSLGVPAGRRVPLKGVADRIDLLTGHRLRVIDYKSGYAPNPKRALQAPIYALCAQERLEARDGARWAIDEAAYVAFSGKRALVPVVRAGAPGAGAVLSSARSRLFEIVDGIEAGVFPPRPHELRICSYCAYTSVCRKDYVGDD